MLKINKEAIGKIELALEAFALSVRSLNETTEDLLDIFEKAQQQSEIEALVLIERLSFEGIKQTVCHYFEGVSVADLEGITKKRNIVEARHVAMLLCYQFIKGTTLAKIGAAFGRDHSTVSYACNTALDLIDTDKTFRKNYFEIKSRLTTAEVENITKFEASEP